MNMIITWGSDCQFMFYSWHTQTTGPFILGLALVFLYSFFSVGFNRLRKFIEVSIFEKDTRGGGWKTFDAVFFALSAALRYSVMILMMTMNGWVNLVLATGMMVGYVVWMMEKEVQGMKGRKRE